MSSGARHRVGDDHDDGASPGAVARLTTARRHVRLTAALALALGCRSEVAPPREITIDLAALLPETGAGPRTTIIDASRPEDAPRLASGWSAPEQRIDGGAGVWMARRVATIRFDAGAAPVAERVVVEGRGMGGPRAFGLVFVEANGVRLGLLDLQREDGRRPLLLSAQAQRPGRNILTFRSPAGRAVIERQPLVFFLERVRFDADGADAPAVTRVPEGLRFAPGAEAPFHLRLPAAARLAVAAPGWPAGLSVRVWPDGGTERTLAPAAGTRELALDSPAGAIVRLAVAAPAAGAPVVLPAPTLHGIAPPSPRVTVARGTRPNVLLYVVDTLRADHLGAYGYGRPTSPHVDAFAREGVLFERAVAGSSWTRPATATILTGEPAARHGAVRLSDALRPDLPTLAESFRAHGWATGGFVTNVNVGDPFGFGRGFDVYQYLREDERRPGLHAPAPEVHAAALAWLDGVGDRPFFLYIHATDPHAPYTPTPELEARFRDPAASDRLSIALPVSNLAREAARLGAGDVAILRGRYDAEIAGLDAAFGDLLATLAERRLDRRTLVVFVADHGEEFMDHGGLEHGRTLYEEQVHVPLVFRLPDRAGAGTRVATLARQVDVAPTVLALAGLPPAGAGRVLVAPDGTPSAGDDEATSETHLPSRGLEALVTTRWKVVVHDAGGAVEVYDLAADPAERHDVAAERPVIAGWGRQRLAELADARAAIAPATEAGAPAALDAETLERLRSLGYVDE